MVKIYRFYNFVILHYFVYALNVIFFVTFTKKWENSTVLLNISTRGQWEQTIKNNCIVMCISIRYCELIVNSIVKYKWRIKTLMTSQ